MGINYTANTKAWMNKEIFSKWLVEFNLELIYIGIKIVLLLDNCSAHTNLNLSNIKMQFYPPNTSAIIQALDLGIIKNFKDHFRHFYMKKLVLGDLEGIKYGINLLDAIIWAKLAAKQIKVSTINNCFRKSLDFARAKMFQFNYNFKISKGRFKSLKIWEIIMNSTIRIQTMVYLRPKRKVL